MPPTHDPTTLVRFEVTPRFEIFYALRAFTEASDRTAPWRNTMVRLPAGFNKLVSEVAPRPMMWALLADSLRDASSDPTFAEILEAVKWLEDSAFQRAVLGGVFRKDEAVENLLAGDQKLSDAAEAEAASGNALVSLLGLHPYEKSGSMATAFNRIISQPADYRADLAHALDQFWNRGFDDTWHALEPELHRRAESLRSLLSSSSLPEFADAARLPVSFNDQDQVALSRRSGTRFPYETLSEIHIIPSAFNDTRIWGAYHDDRGTVRLYFSVYDPSLLETDAGSSRPELAFRALGDTTRYAMACLLADSPKTSVELARAFGISKPTVSHHVQLLRAAGLLEERATEHGVQLRLNRDALEAVSEAAAEEMFSGVRSPVIRRTRREGKSHRPDATQSRTPPRKSR